MHTCTHTRSCKSSYCQVFSRRDQLTLRSGQKAANKEKKGKGKGRSKKEQKKKVNGHAGKGTGKNGKVKKGEREKKVDKKLVKNAKGKTSSKKGRKTKISKEEKLADKTKDEDTAEEVVSNSHAAPAGRKRRGKIEKLRSVAAASTSASSASSPVDSKQHQGKADKAAAAQKRKPESVSKTRGKKPSEKKPKDEKKPRSRRPKKSRTLPTDVDLNEHKKEQRELIDWILDRNIDYNLPEAEFKKKCRAALSQFEYFRHNIYWTRYSCGMTMWDAEGKKTDATTFAFSNHQSSTVVAIACAETFVT